MRRLIQRRGPIPRVDVLGVGSARSTWTQALDVIDGWITATAPALRLRHRRARRDGEPARRDAAADSQRGGARHAGRDAAGVAQPSQRLASTRRAGLRSRPDAGAAASDRSPTGYRHFFYGGAGRRRRTAGPRGCSRRFPGLAVAGTYSPPFRPLTHRGGRGGRRADQRGRRRHRLGRAEHAEAGALDGRSTSAGSTRRC